MDKVQEGIYHSVLWTRVWRWLDQGGGRCAESSWEGGRTEKR